MIKAGKAFESEVQKSLKRLKEINKKNFVWRRIPDASDYAVNWCSNCRTYKKNKLILGKNPADFVFTFKGKTTYLEAKSSMATRYVLDWIKDHQVTDLIEHKQAGCNAYIFLSYRASLAGRRKKKKIYKKNMAWLIFPEDILRIKKDNVSLSWNQIESVGTNIVKKKGVWNLGDILD